MLSGRARLFGVAPPARQARAHLGGALGEVVGTLTQFALSSRAFSMAMTAWLAKLVTNAICLLVKGRTSWRESENEPISSFSLTVGTARTDRTTPSSTAATISGSRST
jgi:hypothetical protein